MISQLPRSKWSTSTGREGIVWEQNLRKLSKGLKKIFIPPFDVVVMLKSLAVENHWNFILTNSERYSCERVVNCEAFQKIRNIDQKKILEEDLLDTVGTMGRWTESSEQIWRSPAWPPSSSGRWQQAEDKQRVHHQVDHQHGDHLESKISGELRSRLTEFWKDARLRSWGLLPPRGNHLLLIPPLRAPRPRLSQFEVCREYQEATTMDLLAHL